MNRKGLIASIAVGVVLLAIGTFVIFINYFDNRLFNSYDVISKWKRKDNNTVQYLFYNENYLKYSKDGASAFDSSGKVIWNDGYEMDSPQADICGEFVVIYDIGGKELFVYNGNDSGTKVETTLPIVKARVAKQGVVAVLLEDTDSNTINICNPYSSAIPVLFEIPTNIAKDGYPIDFDISDDGNNLVASYLIVKNGKVSNQVNFRNFTEVGQDKNQLVSAQFFEENMITHIEFVDNDRVVIFYETGFSVFEEMKQPKQTVKKTFKEKIRSVVFEKKHIGVILNDVKKDGSTLQLFDYKGREELTYPITYDYDKVICHEDELIFTTEKKCNILRTNGKEKFKFTFDHNVTYFLPGKSSGKYLLVDENMLQEIKLH